jgi:hypothetical protein
MRMMCHYGPNQNCHENQHICLKNLSSHKLQDLVTMQ